MYYKGANMLHTLRQVTNNDQKWRKILLGMNKEFYHQTVTTKQIEDYLSEHIGIDLEPFFNQYLRDTKIPVLEYKLNNGQLSYRWSNIVKDFSIPVKITVDTKQKWIIPSADWQTFKEDQEVESFSVDRNFYIDISSKTD
jgi:aminopeptidase N